MQPDTPCTHADAGEAREDARAQLDDAEVGCLLAQILRMDGVEKIHRFVRASMDRLARYTPCPDCGRWRETTP